MEQKYSIEQVLNAKIHEKAKRTIGELSARLFEAEAKAELLQELYNNSQKELEELKGQVPDENAKKNESTKETGSTQVKTVRAKNLEEAAKKIADDTRDWFDINDNDGKRE